MNAPLSRIAARLLSAYDGDDDSSSLESSPSSSSIDDFRLYLPDLLKMAIDISSGLEYLASNVGVG